MIDLVALRQHGLDRYTLTETGSRAAQPFSNTVQGTETFAYQHSSNPATSGFSRLESSTATYRADVSGPGTIRTSGAGAYNVAQQGSGYSLAGDFSLVKTGGSRYAQLDLFNAGNNGLAGNRPGGVDFNPIGAPFDARWGNVAPAAPPKNIDALALGQQIAAGENALRGLREREFNQSAAAEAAQLRQAQMEQAFSEAIVDVMIGPVAAGALWSAVGHTPDPESWARVGAAAKAVADEWGALTVDVYQQMGEGRWDFTNDNRKTFIAALIYGSQPWMLGAHVEATRQARGQGVGEFYGELAEQAGTAAKAGINAAATTGVQLARDGALGLDAQLIVRGLDAAGIRLDRNDLVIGISNADQARGYSEYYATFVMANKAVVNAAASTAVGFVSLGLAADQDDRVLAVTADERARGYGTIYVGARIATEAAVQAALMAIPVAGGLNALRTGLRCSSLGVELFVLSRAGGALLGGALGVWQTNVTSGGKASVIDYVFAGSFGALFGAVNPIVAATRTVGSVGGYYGAKYFGASESDAVMALHVGDIAGGLLGGMASSAWQARAQFNASWGGAARAAAGAVAWDVVGLGAGAMVGLLAKGDAEGVLHGAQAGMNIAGLARSITDMMRWVCFAPETEVRTPQGWRRIDALRPGDAILSAPEDDPTALPRASVVEEVFENRLAVLHLHVGGRVLRTTALHPFWVRERGWTATTELRAGDLLRSHDGQWLAVEEVTDNGERCAVYNLRVAEYHTYFVGGEDWGFSVWAHNQCHPSIVRFREANELDRIRPNPVNVNEGQYRGTVARLRLSRGQSQYGLSPEFGGGPDVLPQYKMTDRAVQENFRRIINQTPGRQFTDMPQVLSHAEFAALYRGYERNGALPARLKMDTDRTLCPFKNGCRDNLHRTLGAFGVDELYIRNAKGDVSRLTPNSPAEHIGRMSLAEWEAF